MAKKTKKSKIAKKKAAKKALKKAKKSNTKVDRSESNIVPNSPFST